MKTPYVQHYFDGEAQRRIEKLHGWLVASVATSIAWPRNQVVVVYDGVEYLLHGAEQDGKPASPSIATHCGQQDRDVALARVLKFASVLGWFKEGYVEVTGDVWSSHPIRYSHRHYSHAEILQGGQHGFDCNYMPIVDSDEIRKALAFWREGQRLRRVHDAYAFLSFYKLVESQFSDAKKRIEWMTTNLNQLDSEDALKRIAALKAQGLDVGEHLFVSGRCAVAHASFGREIVDPDIPADRRRIHDDLTLMEGLAQRYLAIDAAVPTSMSLYGTRNRVEPWHPLISDAGLALLRTGQKAPQGDVKGLMGAKVSVRKWPHPPSPIFTDLKLVPVATGPGVLHLAAVHSGKKFVLYFYMDVSEGKMHAAVEEWGLDSKHSALVEDDVRAFHHLFHSTVGNGLLELTIDGHDPVACEIIIPQNIIPQNPDDAAEQAVQRFRAMKADSDGSAA